MTGLLWSEGALLFRAEKSLDVTRQRDASRADPGSEAAARYRGEKEKRAFKTATCETRNVIVTPADNVAG